MKDMLGRKAFRFSTILILVLIVLGFNVPNIISSVTGGDFSSKVLISDPENLYNDTLGQLANTQDYEFIIEPTDIETIKTKIADGDIDSAIAISSSETGLDFNYVVKNAATTVVPQDLFDTLSTLYQNVQITKLNLTPAQLATLSTPINYEILQVDETEIHGNVMVMMTISIVLFYAIYFCAFQVSSSITIEKTSKIIETLVTSTKPRNIVLGKTIGIGLVGLFQMILFIGTAIICAFTFLDHEMLGSVLDLSNITPWLGIMTVVYFLLGYFAYAMLYALTGSTVNKPEEIQSANTPVALLGAFSFYFAYFTLMDPTSSFNTFAAIFPFSSPFCMPIRMMMGLASWVEVLISIAVLIVSILVIARIAIKIYSDAILNYGTKLSLGELIRMYKQK